MSDLRFSEVREHPRFFEALSLFIALIAFSAVYNFYTGFSLIQTVTGTQAVSQSIIAFDSLAHVNQPPILLLPNGAQLLNASYNVEVNGPTTCYLWIFQFSNSSIHPLPIIEPVYEYWQINGTSAQLHAVYTRFHYYSRLAFGGWTLNGTRIFVSFSPTYYIPTVRGGLISSLLQPSNATVVSNYQVTLNPNLPYSMLSPFIPQYTPDPWQVLNTPETYVNGIEFGLVVAGPVGLGSWALFVATVHPRFHPNRRKWYNDEKIIAAIVEILED